MLHLVRILAASLVLTASALPAQTPTKVVVPRAYATTEAPNAASSSAVVSRPKRAASAL